MVPYCFDMHSEGFLMKETFLLRYMLTPVGIFAKWFLCAVFCCHPKIIWLMLIMPDYIGRVHSYVFALVQHVGSKRHFHVIIAMP